ncbi:Hypothetical predicted protein [Mytilus galloprovincialis]|uniref:Uncharacterized protein n=1 Tax=Mytilus galloprovincialis TaxID=29158 RepID=A0A8B6FII3_MYTGA|nr:Hypothetical predicted protein [Mytilus galloprovincialis]
MWEDQVREKKVQRDRKREDWRRGRVSKEKLEPFSPPSKKIKSLLPSSACQQWRWDKKQQNRTVTPVHQQLARISERNTG